MRIKMSARIISLIILFPESLSSSSFLSSDHFARRRRKAPATTNVNKSTFEDINPHSQSQMYMYCMYTSMRKEIREGKQCWLDVTVEMGT